MKNRVLYSLVAALLLLGACTKEKMVYGEHDVDATIEETKQPTEHKVLYYNLDGQESSAEGDSNLLMLLNAYNVDLAVLTSLKGRDFTQSPLSEELKTAYPHIATKVDGDKLMVVLSRNEVADKLTLSGGVLSHSLWQFEYKGVNFVAGELLEKADLSADSDAIAANHANRAEEAAYLVAQTIDKIENHDIRKWVFLMDMNSASAIDVRYNRTVDEAEAAANTLMSRNGLVDCVETTNSLYAPSSSDGSRELFVYATHKAWQQIVATNVINQVQTQNYPILFTIKCE